MHFFVAVSGISTQLKKKRILLPIHFSFVAFVDYKWKEKALQMPKDIRKPPRSQIMKYIYYIMGTSHIFEEKENNSCVKGKNCEIFQRVRKNEYEREDWKTLHLLDLLHLQGTRHPPRERFERELEEKTTSNSSDFILRNTDIFQEVYDYDINDEKTYYDLNYSTGYLLPLLREIVKNGYAKDLTPYKKDKEHLAEN